MVCYHPLNGYRRRDGGWTASKRLSYRGEPLVVPCGGCDGCRIDRSRQMAVRCVHEASLWPVNSFVTLTYDDDHLPPGGTLRHRDFQLFMKRLRVELTRKGRDMKAEPVRFYMCGEYGETTRRPHYHAIFFNLGFHDMWLLKKERGVSLYVSDFLTETWGHGMTTVGAVTWESCAYVSRYILKKFNGKLAIDHYTKVDSETGEVVELAPEYCQPSRGGTTGRGGIGREWFERFSGDVFPHDFVVIKGKKFKVPEYYGKLLSSVDPGAYAAIKAKRLERAAERSEDNTPERMKVREKVLQARLKRLIRSLE